MQRRLKTSREVFLFSEGLKACKRRVVLVLILSILCPSWGWCPPKNRGDLEATTPHEHYSLRAINRSTRTVFPAVLPENPLLFKTVTLFLAGPLKETASYLAYLQEQFFIHRRSRSKNLSFDRFIGTGQGGLAAVCFASPHSFSPLDLHQWVGHQGENLDKNEVIKLFLREGRHSTLRDCLYPIQVGIEATPRALTFYSEKEAMWGENINLSEIAWRTVQYPCKTQDLLNKISLHAVKKNHLVVILSDDEETLQQSFPDVCHFFSVNLRDAHTSESPSLLKLAEFLSVREGGPEQPLQRTEPLYESFTTGYEKALQKACDDFKRAQQEPQRGNRIDQQTFLSEEARVKTFFLKIQKIEKKRAKEEESFYGRFKANATQKAKQGKHFLSGGTPRTSSLDIFNQESKDQYHELVMSFSKQGARAQQEEFLDNFYRWKLTTLKEYIEQAIGSMLAGYETVASGETERKKRPAEKVLTGVAGGTGFALSHIPFVGPTLGKVISKGGEEAIELYYNAEMIRAGEKIQALYQRRGLKGIMAFSDKFADSLMKSFTMRIGWMNLESMRNFSVILRDKTKKLVEAKDGCVSELPADTPAETFITRLTPGVLEEAKNSSLILKTDLEAEFSVEALLSGGTSQDSSAFAKLQSLLSKENNRGEIGTFFKVMGENLETAQSCF